MSEVKKLEGRMFFDWSTNKLRSNSVFFYFVRTKKRYILETLLQIPNLHFSEWTLKFLDK